MGLAYFVWAAWWKSQSQVGVSQGVHRALWAENVLTEHPKLEWTGMRVVLGLSSEGSLVMQF